MKKIKIRVENLHKTFREEEVLKGITCDFEAGKTHAIVGNNGSGKSVLFKCICGFIKPTEGTITIDDKVIGKDVDFPESMGMIIERPGFLPNMSGFRNLKLLAEIQGKITDTEIRNTISRGCTQILITLIGFGFLRPVSNQYASTERTSRRIVQHIFEQLVTVAMRHGMIYMRIRIDDLSFIGDSHTA